MINIVDDFFTKKQLLNVQNYAGGAFYKPVFFTQSRNKENKNREDSYGIRHLFELKSSLGKIIHKRCLKKFSYIIKDTYPPGQGALDKRKLDVFQPHNDGGLGKVNLYIQLIGPTAVSNGICFYDKDQKLDMHIGFRENRAVLFDSKIVHTPNVSSDKIWRTTITLFINKGDFK
tara:strand:+ start:1039 stop:1560 length:522 start_codon:yes stop_codon:yes gene_type:complete